MSLNLSDFLYDLPEDRIAKHPLPNRADSRLLYYNKGAMQHYVFNEIPQIVKERALLVFNDTRVIPARIIMSKETGARIELFLLEPMSPSNVHEEVMNSHKTCSWRCMIGNAKKWKQETVLKHDQLAFTATRVAEDVVQFNWKDDIPFSALLIEIGKIPLPPYLNREAEDGDEERYQTVYSKMEGAVAAPTAGLHFTDEVIEQLEDKGVKTDYLTLHVSAGTFQPIKSSDVKAHEMHNEQVWVSKENVKNLLEAEQVIAVGTTAMRTLESLYWFGVRLTKGYEVFHIHQNDPYELKPVPKEDSLAAVLQYMEEKGLAKLGGQTEIYIYPGYDFKICEGLVTNYHLPGSTLILLVSAFIGDDWRKVYQEALDNEYRFLSYGDSSLLMRNS